MDGGTGAGHDDVWLGIDVGHLTPGQRTDLSRLLDSYGVPHEHVGSELQAAAAELELVEDLLARVEAGAIGEPPPPPSPYGRADLAPASTLDAAIASRWDRLWAPLVEGLVVWLLVLPITALAGDAVGALAGTVIGIASGTLLVRTGGQTLGMLMVGTRIVVAPSVAPPTWRPTLVRYLTVHGPYLVVAGLAATAAPSLAGVASGTALLWELACFAPILWDRHHRGLHDLAAGTVVVDAHAEGPLTDEPYGP